MWYTQRQRWWGHKNVAMVRYGVSGIGSPHMNGGAFSMPNFLGPTTSKIPY